MDGWMDKRGLFKRFYLLKKEVVFKGVELWMDKLELDRQM